MYILGISGGSDLSGEKLFEGMENVTALSHDAAAVLLKDGKIVAAAEEERLTRVKHTNRAPLHAVQFCLDEAGIALKDVDFVAYYLMEEAQNKRIFNFYATRNVRHENLSDVEKITSARELIADRFRRFFNEDISSRLRFVNHHLAHAVSTYIYSGYDKGLVAVFDAFGDGASGLISRGENGRIEKLRVIETKDSLGGHYSQVIDYLGFRIFDEYKVMGLAPYGDPSRFRSLFQELYTLNREGNYSLSFFDRRLEKLKTCCPPRKKGQPIEQVHKDLAAALQESLENIVMHVLTFYRREFSLPKLCLAGGVTHNCTMNGKIAKSGLFDSVFVQPAAHDAGTALGAATHVYLQEGGKWAPQKLGPIYFGHNVQRENIEKILECWSSFLSFEKVQNVEQATAQLLADGYVVGWVQGKSEFGPRALGNRSIIADPRPMENKDRINAMVKKREGFRPFAPSVIEEAASTYFEIPKAADGLQYMIFVVDVKEDQRQKLGAVTHVNGSARVQTVSRADNPRFWGLIKAFGDITGVPVVLNTSFNNHAEPIVDTATDAITSFLTTELDYLVIDNFIAKKKNWDLAALSKMKVTVPKHVHLCCNANLKDGQKYWLSYIYDEMIKMNCTKEAFEFLRGLFEKQEDNGHQQSLSLEEWTPEKKALWKELFELWSHRFVVLNPKEY